MGVKIDKNIKALHGAKRPDEVYIDEENKIIFMIEKKIKTHQGLSVNVCKRPLTNVAILVDVYLTIKLYICIAYQYGLKKTVKLN